MIILRMPPFLGVSPLFGIEAQGAGSVGVAEVVAVVIGEGLGVVVTGVVVVAAGVLGAGAFVFGGVVVVFAQPIMTMAQIIITPRIIWTFFTSYLLSSYCLNKGSI